MKVEIDEKELARLRERDEWLSALEAAGVDNWQGIEEAIRIRKEWIAEDDSLPI